MLGILTGETIPCADGGDMIAQRKVADEVQAIVVDDQITRELREGRERRLWLGSGAQVFEGSGASSALVDLETSHRRGARGRASLMQRTAL